MELKRKLPNWIKAWSQLMDNSEAPNIYNKWTAVSMIASALERKCFLSWDKKIYPNFFIILVGDAGCRKGTAMSPAREMLDECNFKIAADATTKEKLVSRLEEANTPFETMDGGFMQYCALTIFSEEFTVFLGYDNKDLMQWMADWYDCKNIWRYETKHNEVNAIEGMWVNLIGATTPELLQSSLPRESFGGGLNSRIVYVYASPLDVKMIPFPHHAKKNDTLYGQLKHDLELMHLIAGEFIPDKSYESCWLNWYPRSKDIELNEDRRMTGYMNRRGTHLHKLAMIMNISSGRDLTLTDKDFNDALKLLEETERVMKKTFEGVGRSQLASLMTNIVSLVRIKKEVPYSKLIRDFHYDADEREFAVAITTLRQSKLLELRKDEGTGETLVCYLG